MVVSFCIGARTAFENERGIQFADHGDAGGMAGVVGMRRPFAATHVQVHVEVHVEVSTWGFHAEGSTLRFPSWSSMELRGIP